MAQQNSPQEPTMEEILASIRRIISEDAEEPAKAEEPAAEAAADFEPEPLELEDEVLELDEVVEEDRLDAYAAEPEPEPEPEPAPPPPPPKPVVQAKVERKPAPPPPAPVMEDEDEDVDLVDQEADMSEGLLSSATSSVLADAFGKLDARAKIAHDPTNTLEDLVRQLLTPLLKDWLEDNLPPLVERLVQEEIERVQRTSGRRR